MDNLMLLFITLPFLLVFFLSWPSRWDYVFPWPKARYVVAIEHFARARSCYIYTLTPRYWLRLAWLCAKVHVFLWESECRWIVLRTANAEKVIASYRNWNNENRVGG